MPSQFKSQIPTHCNSFKILTKSSCDAMGDVVGNGSNGVVILSKYVADASFSIVTAVDVNGNDVADAEANGHDIADGVAIALALDSILAVVSVIDALDKDIDGDDDNDDDDDDNDHSGACGHVNGNKDDAASVDRTIYPSLQSLI